MLDSRQPLEGADVADATEPANTAAPYPLPGAQAVRRTKEKKAIALKLGNGTLFFIFDTIRFMLSQNS